VTIVEAANFPFVDWVRRNGERHKDIRTGYGVVEVYKVMINGKDSWIYYCPVSGGK
jgi:hypothetical protein